MFLIAAKLAKNYKTTQESKEEPNRWLNLSVCKCSSEHERVHKMASETAGFSTDSCINILPMAVWTLTRVMVTKHSVLSNFKKPQLFNHETGTPPPPQKNKTKPKTCAHMVKQGCLQIIAHLMQEGVWNKLCSKKVFHIIWVQPSSSLFTSDQVISRCSTWSHRVTEILTHWK